LVKRWLEHRVTGTNRVINLGFLEIFFNLVVL
jgi:hypothetical protein